MGDTKLHLVRRGTAIILAATLSTGMVPAMALADADGAGAPQATASAAATTPTLDGFYLETGKEYTVPVALMKENGTDPSMAAQYFEKNGAVKYEDGSYQVTFSVTADGQQYIKGISYDGIEDLGNGKYRVTVKSLDGLIPLKFDLEVPLPSGPMVMTQTGYLKLDTSSLPTEPPAPSADKSALTDAITSAGKVVQGNKTDDAFKALQDAIAAAQKVADNADATQADVDGAVAALNEAIDAFNSSENVVKPSGESYESSFKLYYKGADATDKFGKSFHDKVVVTPLSDGTYEVDLTANSLGSAATLGDVTVGGKAVAYTDNEDGSRTYKMIFASITGKQDFTFSYTITAINRTNTHEFQIELVSGETTPVQVDKSALKAALDKANALTQGNKTDEAWKTLQDAIATAQKAYDTEGIPQQGVDAVTKTLNAAIDTFTNSADKTPETPGGYALEEGKEYTVPVALMKENGTDPSMAAQFFEKDGTVVYRDGSYQVTFSVTADGLKYIKGVSADAIEDLGNGSYRVTVKSLDNLIPLTFNLQTPVGAMSQTGYLKVDTTSLPKANGNQGGNQGGDNNGGQQGGNNNQNNNNNGNQGGNNGGQEQPGDTAQFQVGHTYQVPIAFMKQNSSEASMAAQYFYTTALVRPQQDGTFNVSFSATSEGLTHIIQLAHNGATLSNDNGTFTVNIPAATQDTVVPISMTIKEMQQLGGGPQTADMHLYLTQAKDLGTGQDGLTPAGTPGATAGNGAGAAATAKGSALAKTADGAPTAAVTGIAAMAAAAMAAAGTMLRRRFNK